MSMYFVGVWLTGGGTEDAIWNLRNPMEWSNLSSASDFLGLVSPSVLDVRLEKAFLIVSAVFRARSTGAFDGLLWL